MPVATSSRPTNNQRETSKESRSSGHQVRPNLTTSPKKRQRGQWSSVNVGDLERGLSVIGGSALAIYGLTRESLGGMLIAGCGGALVYRGLSGHCSAYNTLGISTARKHGVMTSVPAAAGCKVDKTVRINRSAQDLYLFWRNFENLPSFMSHLASVKKIDGRRSRWFAKGPFGIPVEWEAEVHTARPNELISWRSLPASEINTAGSVHFVPVSDGRATDVHVVLKYDPPAGRFGAALAHWFGDDPDWQIEADLNELKRRMEDAESRADR